MLLGFYVFFWPLILPIISLVAMLKIGEDRVVAMSAILITVLAASALPLIYSLIVNPHPEGLAISSLLLYGVTLAAIGVTTTVRLVGRAARNRPHQSPPQN